MASSLSPGDLRPYVGRFVGRAKELADIEARVPEHRRSRDVAAAPNERARARVVVLVGIAGIGKTRLAAELARRRSKDDPTRARWCDLTDAREAVDVCTSLARALEVPLPPDATFERMRELVGRTLSKRGSLLVVFDNFEGVAAHAAETLGFWLEASPELVAVATSRISLALGTAPALVEQIAIEPLRLVAAKEGDTSEALELFLDRAAHVCAADWQEPEEREALARALEHLDGLPLALELAAARMALLSPADLARALSQTLDVLSQPSALGARPGTDAAGGGVAENRRHRSMRAAIETSYVALDEPVRRALAATSLLRGGFLLEDLEAVLGDSAERGDGRVGRSGDGATALDALQLLIQRSFVRLVGAVDGRSQFDTYDVVRKFAADKLAESGEARAAERRSEVHFGRVAASFLADARRGKTITSALSARRENLTLVVTRIIERGAGGAEGRTPEDTTNAALAAAALGLLYAIRAEPGGYVALLERLTRRAPAWLDALPANAAMELGVMATQIYRWIGDIEVAERWADATVALGAVAGDAELRASASLERALVHLRRGRLDEAKADIAEAERVARPVGNTALEATIDQFGANVLVRALDLGGALTRIARGLTLAAKVGNPALEGKMELFYGWILFEKGNATEALPRLLRARALCESHDERATAAYATVLAAVAALQLGRFSEAGQWTREGLDEARRFGHARAEGIAFWLRGVLRQVANETALALDDYKDSLRSDGFVVDVWIAPLLYGAQGAAFAELGQLQAAEVAFAQADAVVVQQREAGRGQTGEAFVDAMRGVLDIARAQQAALEGNVGASTTHRARAEARLRACQERAGRGSGIRELGFALIVLQRNFDRLAPPDDSFVVEANGLWMQPPGGARVDLARKPVLGRLVVALVEHHARREEAALSRQALVEACWPGERVPEELAANRIAVSLAKLRQLGLRDILETRPGGLCLRPDTRVVRVCST